MPYRVAQRIPGFLDSLNAGMQHKRGDVMATRPTWPAGPMDDPPDRDSAHDQTLPETDLLDHVDAHAVIGEMAGLLRETRGHMLACAGLLGAIAIGIAAETGAAARTLHPGLTDVINIGLMCPLFCCWLVAAILVAMAGRPVLNALSETRWVTGAPLDPRAPWLTLPPPDAHPEAWTWIRAHLLVGAARMARYRIQLADTWTCVAAASFLLWTAIISLGH
jgi:hypothetical protein